MELPKKGLSLGALKKDRLRISGDAIFYTLQGEGVTIGVPSIFLRLHECNLKCVWCDAYYTWDKTRPEYWAEAKEWSIDETIIDLVTFTGYDCSNYVITGGEPLMQRDQLDKVIEGVLKYQPHAKFEIETNGTIAPSERMIDWTNCLQFNVSPKLSNSDNQKHQMFKPKVLNVFVGLNSWFKFVVSREEDVNEIMEYAAFLPNNRIILMPEGTTREALHEHQIICDKLCKEHNWRLTPRLQVELYGDTRAT